MKKILGKKNSTKSWLVTFVIIVIFVGCVWLFAGKGNWFNTDKAQVEQNAQDESSINNEVEDIAQRNDNEEITTNKEQISNSNGDEIRNKENTSKIKFSNADIVKLLLYTKNFDNGQTLTDEEYLNIVYNALNEGIIIIDEQRSPLAGKSKVEFSSEEINNIVESIFGVRLNKNKSLGTALTYSNGKYTLQFSDRGSVVNIAKDIETDVAAGTIYVNYDLYVSDEEGESYEGSFAIGVRGETGVVISKKRMNN